MHWAWLSMTFMSASGSCSVKSAIAIVLNLDLLKCFNSSRSRDFSTSRYFCHRLSSIFSSLCLIPMGSSLFDCAIVKLNLSTIRYKESSHGDKF